MGSQQLLLIVLGVIIIGIAFTVGIAMFNRQALLSHRREIVAEMNQMMVEAMAYKKMPASLGGGSGRFWGYMPSGAEPYTRHIGSPGNGGARLLTDTVNYYIEWWAEGAYPQRVKITASSTLYGEGNYWPNTYNARIIASYDAAGKLLRGSTNPNQNGFQITGDWVKP